MYNAFRCIEYSQMVVDKHLEFSQTAVLAVQVLKMTRQGNIRIE